MEMDTCRKRKRISKLQLEQEENNQIDILKTNELLSLLDAVPAVSFNPTSEFLQITLMRSILYAIFDYIDAIRFGISRDLIEIYLNDFYLPILLYRTEHQLSNALFMLVIRRPTYFATISLMSQFDPFLFQSFMKLILKKISGSIYQKMPEIPIPNLSVKRVEISFERVQYRVMGMKKMMHIKENRQIYLDILPVDCYDNWWTDKYEDLPKIHEVWRLWFQAVYLVYRNDSTANEDVSSEVSSASCQSYLTWLSDEVVSDIMSLIRPHWTNYIKVNFN